MSQQARVSSIFMLKQLRASLATFAKTASVSLEEAATEIQRTLRWLREDQYRYWKAQVRTRNDQYVQAKLNLKRKEIFDRALAGTRGSCVDERKALNVAERRLREAERILRHVTSWSQQIEKELSDYRGAVRGLVNAIDVEIPNARARLDKMVESLEAYIALAPPEMPRPPEEAGAVGAAPPVGMPPVPDGQSTPLQNDREKVKALRKTTPSQGIRRDTPVGPNLPGWATNLRLSEALCAAVLEDAGEKLEARADDKVVVARPDGEPDVIYLERTAGEDGDSGWYLGAGEKTESTGYAAARVADLLKACPALTGVLSLPQGCLVLADIREGSEMVFGPDDRVLWRGRQSDEAAKEQ